MLLRSALASLAREVRESGATITNDRLPRVMGDSDRLTSLFRNLIDNSLKYRGAAAPQIEIQAKQGHGHWLFSVRDNGIGIDRKYWDGIFDPFSRLHGPEIPGVGLGLAICRKILDAHGGTIRIDSVVGNGTTPVLFTIPAEDAASALKTDLRAAGPVCTLPSPRTINCQILPGTTCGAVASSASSKVKSGLGKSLWRRYQR